MKKRILWIVLGVLIIILVGLSWFYIKNKNGEVDEIPEGDNDTSVDIVRDIDEEISGIWYYEKADSYQEEELISSKVDEGIHSLIFYETVVDICSSIENQECVLVKYKRDENSINIDSDGASIIDGDFKLYYLEGGKMMLEQEIIQGSRILYYFRMPGG